ncbi:hypothetical protein [Nocardia sp. XZ_19_369]|nr:hypothetical protein [Nocardia sp. XZ_19_369]
MCADADGLFGLPSFFADGATPVCWSWPRSLYDTARQTGSLPT